MNEMSNNTTIVTAVVAILSPFTCERNVRNLSYFDVSSEVRHYCTRCSR